MKKMLLRSILVSLVLTIVGSASGFLYAANTVSTVPVSVNVDWWKSRHKAKLAEVQANQGNIDLVMLGDSITHFWENTGFWKDHGNNVWKKYYGNRKALNLGYGGDRTEHVLWRIDHGELDGISPKLIILMIGTNNASYHSCTNAQAVDGIKAVLASLEKKLPETKILLLAIFPRGADENDGLRQKVNEINKSLPAMADGKRVFFLDIGDKFLDENKVLSKSIMPDLLHPNERGYQIWAEAIEPTVKELLGGK